MRANILVVLVLLLVGIGASLLLIPRSGELALQKFRDRDYDSARAVYEERYAAGDRSGATVMPLTRLALAQGDVERAIDLTEAFVIAEPSSVEARELLDRLYRDAQRPGDYLENLKALAELRRSADLFRELAYAAGFRDRMALKAEALARYCALRPDDVDAQQELAALLAARGDHAGAVDWLLRADDRAKGNIQPDGRELLMSLLIDLDREDEAFDRARRWLGEQPTVADMIGLASQLAAAARPDLALRLIEPQVTKREHVLALELTYIDLLIATDRRDQARLRLAALPGPVEDAQFGRLLALEVNAGMMRAALATTEGRDLLLVPDWVLAGLAETALREGDRTFPDRLYRELGDGFLGDYPLLAANIALGRGDSAAAADWAARALAGDALMPGDRLSAVRILDRAGRRAAAVAAFDRLTLTGSLPEESLEELAALFMDFDRTPAGLAWFADRRQAAPSPAADQGWARLAAKSGDPAAVAAWLAGQPKLPLALLQDIAGSAAERASSNPPARDRPAAALALAASQRAFALEPSPRSRLALASALTVNGKPAEALPLLAPLLADGGVEVESAYIAALDGAGRSEELARHLTAKLAKGGLSDADQRSIVAMLLDHKAYRAALPLLRVWAERQGGNGAGDDWLGVYADAAAKANALPDLLTLLESRSSVAPLAEAEDSLYRDTLAKLGRKAELRRYLLARATDGRLPADRRREPVSALLALGDKAGAEQALQRLAAGQGPQSEDFKQLVYLWGPRPPAAGLDWIEARAKAAYSPAEQAAWYDRLTDYGGGRRVIAGLAGNGGGRAGTQGAVPVQPALKSPYIEALAAAGKGKELADAVRAALPEETAPDRLRRYARLAEQTGQRAAAAQAWTALLARKPEDADALRQLGMLAYDENRLADAERLLRRYVATGPDDYEAHYFLGEALTALKRPTAATPFYRTALSQLRARAGRGDAAIQTEANLLNRLGKVDDAVALFKALRKRRPADRQLKADYASMLIENGRLPEARRVLALP
ncbi:tetratricopeptide repeat protein [Azospirillum endophyticum]